MNTSKLFYWLFLLFFLININSSFATTFYVVGDTCDGSAAQKTMRDRMVATGMPNFLVHTGDMAYDAGTVAEQQANFFTPYKPFFDAGVTFYPCSGNHDNANKSAWLQQHDPSVHLLSPTTNPGQTWYSFDAGNAHFLVLDSNAPSSAPQKSFAQADLASSLAAWKFVFFHHTMYSNSRHGSSSAMRSNFRAMFENTDVDVVFAGHDHDYERTKPLLNDAPVPQAQGIVYVTTGGGGKDLYPAGSSAFTAKSESVHHFTKVDVNGSSICLTMIRDNGTIGDSSCWTKGASPGTTTTTRPAGTSTTSTSTTSSSTSTLRTTSTSRPPGTSTTSTRPVPVTTTTSLPIPTTCGAVKDYRGKLFKGPPTVPYPISLTGPDNLCVLGGEVMGSIPTNASWSTAAHHPNSAAVAIANSKNFVVDGLRGVNLADGIRPRDNVPNWTIKNVGLAWVRDDCIENDHVFGGDIEGSLFDGCYVGLSERPSPSITRSGANEVVTIRNSLFRLQPFPQPDNGPDPGHGAFFKWSDKATKLAIYDSVFRMDQVPGPGAAKAGIPPGAMLDCARNILVWLGPGPVPGSWPACFTITRDISVWNAARTQWAVAHGYPF